MFRQPMLTDNDSGLTVERFLALTPSLTLSVVVDSPREMKDLAMPTYDEKPLGGYSYRLPEQGVISQEVHEALLGESLEKYEGIWRSLASR